MRFYTEQECEAWLSGLKRKRPEAETARPSDRITYDSAKAHRIFFFAHAIAESLTHGLTQGETALLWIDQWDIWPGGENWHLYYRLRQSYGDLRLLAEAPGHLFLGYESAALATFLHLAMLNGWGGCLLTELNYINASFNHDGFIELFGESEAELAALRQQLAYNG